MRRPQHHAPAARASPRFPADETPGIAEQGVADAVEAASDLRCYDPAYTWGRMTQMVRTDPHRLMALAVAALAMVDVDRPVSELLAWTDGLEVA